MVWDWGIGGSGDLFYLLMNWHVMCLTEGMNPLVTGIAQVGANVLGNVVDRVLPESFKASAIGKTFSSVLKGVNSTAGCDSPLAVGLERAGIGDNERLAAYKETLRTLLMEHPEIRSQVEGKGPVMLNLMDGNELSLLCNDGTCIKIASGGELHNIGMTLHQVEAMQQVKNALPGISVKQAANRVSENPQFAANWRIR